MIFICSTTLTFQSSNYTCTYVFFYCDKCDDDNDSDKDNDNDDDNNDRNDNNNDNYIFNTVLTSTSKIRYTRDKSTSIYVIA